MAVSIDAFKRVVDEMELAYFELLWTVLREEKVEAIVRWFSAAIKENHEASEKEVVLNVYGSVHSYWVVFIWERISCIRYAFCSLLSFILSNCFSLLLCVLRKAKRIEYLRFKRRSEWQHFYRFFIRSQLRRDSAVEFFTYSCEEFFSENTLSPRSLWISWIRFCSHFVISCLQDMIKSKQNTWCGSLI